jgi:hypothetical protein
VTEKEELVNYIQNSPRMEDVAKWNRDKVVEIKRDVEKNFLDLGMLLCQNRDNSLWEILDYESIESFFGDPKVGLKRSTAYGLMQVWDFYITKLQIAQDDLAEVGVSKLKMLVAHVDKDNVLEWIDKAKALSKSDLKLELAGGGASLSPNSGDSLPPFNKSTAPAFSSDRCINGCSDPPEKSHFPVGRGAGQDEVEDWWLPMCNKCHQEFHQDGKEFTWKYKRNWARWMYAQIRHD